MNGVTVKRDGGKWTYSPAVYWPGSEVDFYAVSPTTIQGDTPSNDPNTIAGLYAGDVDFLYAVSLNEYEKPTPVNLTFRHAMSRVVVNLSSTNMKYNVKVYHVMLCNMFLKGDFTFPAASTTTEAGKGTWSNLSIYGSRLTYYDHGASTSLTPTPTDIGNMEQAYFIPQTLDKFEFTRPGTFNGAYLQIDCEIYDKVTGERIWPSEHTPDYLLVAESQCGRMVFPLTTKEITEWKAGYAYTYNVIINNAYIVDTIEFEPTVVDFTEVTPY